MLRPALLLIFLGQSVTSTAFGTSCTLLFGNENLDPNVQNHGKQISEETVVLLRGFDTISRNAFKGLRELERVLYLADAAGALLVSDQVLKQNIPALKDRDWMLEIPMQSVQVLSAEFPKTSELIEESFSELVKEVEHFLIETANHSTNSTAEFNKYLTAASRAIEFNVSRINLAIASIDMPKTKRAALLDISLFALERYDEKLSEVKRSLDRAIESINHLKADRQSHTPTIGKMLDWLHRDKRGELVPNDDYRDLVQTRIKDWNQTLTASLNTIRSASTRGSAALKEIDQPKNTHTSAE